MTPSQEGGPNEEVAPAAPPEATTLASQSVISLKENREAGQRVQQRRRGAWQGPRIDAMVAAASQANRPFIQRIVLYKRNKGLRLPSIYGWTHALTRLDTLLKGAPFQACGADELAWAISQLHADPKLSQNTVAAYTGHIKAAWKDVLNTDYLPRDIRKALDVSEARLDEPAGRLITEAEFHRILDEATRLRKGREGLPAPILAVALLWTLWDSGFRADEMLSLNVGDVILFPTGVAKLRLRPEAPSLGQGEHKTGPRIITVGECVGPLKALLAMHPDGGNPNAPLFPNMFRASRRAEDRMQYQQLNKLLTRIARASGVNTARSELNNLTAHDFRHTCATRKARLGWQESLMRAHFGWGRDSRMPSYYTHLNEQDLMDRVLRDMGINAQGYAADAPVASDAQALANALANLIAQQRQAAARTRPPPDHALP
ncbi:MAG: tyrosine-type recombinase/integrase [Thermoplasmatota archaeon]